MVDLNRATCTITLAEDKMFELRCKGELIASSNSAIALANEAFNRGADKVVHSYYVPLQY